MPARTCSSKFDPNGKALMVLGRKPENIPVRPGPGIPASMPDVKSAELPGAAPKRVVAAAVRAAGAAGAARRAPASTATASTVRPTSTWDKAGNVYVADGCGGNNRIAKFTRDGNFVKTFGSTGSGNGQFNGIRGLVSDAAGNI
mgnify:CR=1 FL=1